MSVSFCLPHPVAVSAFIICRGLCACTEMLWMCVLYVSFGSKVRPRTFGCIAMGSALLFIARSLCTSRLQTSPLQTSTLQSSLLQTSPLQTSPLQTSPL